MFRVYVYGFVKMDGRRKYALISGKMINKRYVREAKAEASEYGKEKLGEKTLLELQWDKWKKIKTGNYEMRCTNYASGRVEIERVK